MCRHSLAARHSPTRHSFLAMTQRYIEADIEAQQRIVELDMQGLIQEIVADEASVHSHLHDQFELCQLLIPFRKKIGPKGRSA